MRNQEKICPNCGGLIKIRNPTGECDHLYYPENLKNDVKNKEPKCSEKDHDQDGG